MVTQDGPKNPETQKAAASSLQRQIEDVVSGRAKPKRPASLRDFVDQAMEKDRSKAGAEKRSPKP